MIEESIKTYLEEGLLPGISVWKASFFPAKGVTTCEALRLHGWENSQVQIGASELHSFSTVIPAWHYEEDGVMIDEPEYTKVEDYKFLCLEELLSRELKHASTHEIFVGSLESVDAIYATYCIPTTGDGKERTMLAGLRFNYTEGFSGGFESSFAIIQKTPKASLELGPASVVLRDLPAHFSSPTRLFDSWIRNTKKSEQGD